MLSYVINENKKFSLGKKNPIIYFQTEKKTTTTTTTDQSHIRIKQKNK